MTSSSLRAGSVLLLVLLGFSPPARSVPECGGENDSCKCGGDNFCICDGTCGNCVWHAWEMACCHWGRALEWCTNAENWNDQAQAHGYPLTNAASSNTVFVCEGGSPGCSSVGHVGWVVAAYPDGSFDSTEQYWGGPCGTFNKHRGAGYATGGFICDPTTGCQGAKADGATLTGETIPDGTHFTAGQVFTMRWTMKNTGTTTWTKGENYLWTFDGGEQFGAATQILLPDGSSVAPGASQDWDVVMTAPATPGSYKGFWRMDHYGTARFGDRVWIDIVVDAIPENDGGGQADAGPDAGPDSVPDAGTDAGPDSSPDSGADRSVSKDGGSDAGTTPDGPTDERAGENLITGGCGCGEAAPTAGSAMEFLALLGLSGFLVRRRRTAPATSAGSPHPPRHPGCARPGR